MTRALPWTFAALIALMLLLCCRMDDGGAYAACLKRHSVNTCHTIKE